MSREILETLVLFAMFLCIMFSQPIAALIHAIADRISGKKPTP